MKALEGRYWRRPRSAWTEMEFVHEAPKIHEAILADLRSAQRSIDFETYIFELDRVGMLYLEEFTLAVKRGVKVRLLLDGIGSWTLQKETLEELRRRGIQVRLYRPFHRWAVLGLRRFLMLGLKRFFAEVPWVNRRDHRKLCLIDRKIAWVGSANISERHLLWRETQARLTGPDMPFFKAGFEVVWATARKTFADRDEINALRLKLYRHPLALSSARVKNKVGFMTWWSAARYREMLLAGARQRIWIASPYFIPTTRFLRKLLLASKRGIDVRVMVPKTSDWRITDWVAKTHYRVLLESGVRIFEYGPRMMHAKITYVDDLIMTGSSNYNHRSIIHDLELDVILDDPQAVRHFDEQWLKDSESCKEVRIEDLKKLSLSAKVMGRVLLVFRFVM